MTLKYITLGLIRQLYIFNFALLELILELSGRFTDSVFPYQMLICSISALFHVLFSFIYESIGAIWESLSPYFKLIQIILNSVSTLSRFN